MLIDTHCHINDDRLIKDIDYIVEELKNNNIAFVVNIGYDLNSSRISVDLADRYEKIFAAVGFHPNYIDNISDDTFNEIISLAKHKKVIAIGEIGLDYHYSIDFKEKQKEAFIKQLIIADNLKLPIIIHSRDAHEDTFNTLNENRDKLKNGIIMHCFSGSSEMVKQYNKFDCYYAFGGIATYGNSKSKVINAVPENRLLLETDCPYNTPIPFKGNINYPHYIKYTAERIAEFKGKTISEIEDITSKNAKDVFRLNKFN